MKGEFYCDIGFKAVLRKIRSYIFKQAKLPQRPSQLKYDIKKSCLSFFYDQVLGREIDQDDALALKQVNDIMIVYLDLDSASSGAVNQL